MAVATYITLQALLRLKRTVTPLTPKLQTGLLFVASSAMFPTTLEKSVSVCMGIFPCFCSRHLWTKVHQIRYTCAVDMLLLKKTTDKAESK